MLSISLIIFPSIISYMWCSSRNWGSSPVPDKFVDLFSWRRGCLVAAAPQPRRGNHRHWWSSAVAVAAVITTTIATTLVRFFTEGPAKAQSPVTGWGPLFWGLEKMRNISSIKFPRKDIFLEIILNFHIRKRIDIYKPLVIGDSQHLAPQSLSLSLSAYSYQINVFTSCFQLIPTNVVDTTFLLPPLFFTLPSRLVFATASWLQQHKMLFHYTMTIKSSPAH